MPGIIAHYTSQLSDCGSDAIRGFKLQINAKSGCLKIDEGASIWHLLVIAFR
jgi:hypothetical protein